MGGCEALGKARGHPLARGGLQGNGLHKQGGDHHPLQAAFDGNPKRVVVFITQVLSYVDLYGQFYLTQWSMVVAITAVMTGEAADWVADLHSDHAHELTDVGLFLEGLGARFEDDTRTQVAEGELVTLKLRGRPAKDYIKEFRRLASRVRAWPECLLVHHFHLGLDHESNKPASTGAYLLG